MALEEVAVAGAGEETQVLRVRLARDGEPGALGELARLLLAQAAEREAQPRERAGRERGEHVALILALVGGDPEQWHRRLGAGLGVEHPRVVAGREGR